MSDFFGRFQHSAWRLETQPFYAFDAEEFQRDQQGLPPTDEQQTKRQWWLDGLAEAAGNGQEVGRVLVVTLPLSPYHRWRVETGRRHAAAGEDVRIADAGEHPALAVLALDFWLLDDELVQLMVFDDVGRFQHMTESRNPPIIEAARWQRELAVARSVPLQEFLQPA